MANYLVLLDCFPLFLHSLTCLITLILWLKFFHRPKAGGGHGGKDHKVLLHFKTFLSGKRPPQKAALCLESEFSRPPSLGEGNRCFLPFCPSLRTVWKSLRNPTVAGNSLAVQWLGLAAFTAVAWVGSLVGKLRPCKLCGMMRKERKTNSGFVDQESEVTSSPHLACQSLRHHRSGRGVAVASLIFLMW